MNLLKPVIIASISVLLMAPVVSQAGDHPKLAMTRDGVERIRAEMGKLPLFDETLAKVKAEVDAEIALGIDTPIPRDFSGGYTHERHKRNFFIIQKAGALFQILDDESYARYVREMLFQYEAMYQDLPLHPKERSYARGKLFWQCLNDANWLLYVSQAYDAIYDWLSAEERKALEDNLFRPFADHISVDNTQFFNRVHNHSTWGTAAVGMIGLVMGDDELLERALYGIKDAGLNTGIKDDDGGFITVVGQKAGFLANLDGPFSPDGYYTEGPYYQRYAMYPFLVFAQALHNTKPDLRIFDYGDGVLLKAVDALLQLSDANGEFFPLNDGQKGMSYHARELVSAVDTAYHVGEQDPELLSIAKEQGQVLLDDAGLSVALAVRDGRAKTFIKKSMNFRDGSDGSEGGVAVLRHGNEDLALVFKYAAQGLSHGHYDKLSFSLYEKGAEVIQDYGLARFVNIEQKGGGNYLPENTSWAKQTIAHNTLTVNGASHFQGKYEIGSQHHSVLHFYDDSDPNVQVASAVESNAYPGVEMRRTMAVIGAGGFGKPFVLDLLKVVSTDDNQYDLPFYFMGQVIDANTKYESPVTLSPLGDKNGYQHLYVEGRGNAAPDNTRLTWLGAGGYYTLTSVTDVSDEILFTRTGANDPDFNLRRDAGFMVRRSGAGNTVFATVIEPHGGYDPDSELSVDSKSRIKAVRVVHDDDNYTAVTIETVDGDATILAVAHADATEPRRHQLRLGARTYNWTGPYYFGKR